MKKVKKYIAGISLCLSLVVPNKSHAIFGMGDIVFDPGQTITSVVEFIRDTGVDIKTGYKEVEQSLYQYEDQIMMTKAAVDDAEKLARLAMTIRRLTEANDIAGVARVVQDHSVLLQEINLAKWMSADWDTFAAEQFMRILEEMTKGEAIGIYVSEVDSLFANKYKGWEAYKDEVYNTGMFMDKYAEWSVINRDTVKAALKTIGIQASEVTSEKDLMIKLKQKSSTAEGNMQVLQVANELSSVGVGQMQKMRQLLMTQTQMQAAFYASEQDERDLLNAQAQAATMKEYVDGKKPIMGNATWNDTGFKMKVK